MSMARQLQATSYRQAMNFHGQPTVNVVITPALAASNFAPDSLITRRHEVYAFIFPALLGLLQIQSAANTTPPIQVHLVTTAASVFGVLGYYLAFMAWSYLPQYATQLSIAMEAFGSFALASLITQLLPPSWWHMKYIIYVLLAVVELHQLLIVLYDRYARRFMLRMRRSWQPNSSTHNLLPRTRMDLREPNNAYLMEAYQQRLLLL